MRIYANYQIAGNRSILFGIKPARRLIMFSTHNSAAAALGVSRPLSALVFGAMLAIGVVGSAPSARADGNDLTSLLQVRIKDCEARLQAGLPTVGCSGTSAVVAPRAVLVPSSRATPVELRAPTQRPKWLNPSIYSQ
jgi:hypothetical protein